MARRRAELDSAPLPDLPSTLPILGSALPPYRLESVYLDEALQMRLAPLDPIETLGRIDFLPTSESLPEVDSLIGATHPVALPPQARSHRPGSRFGHAPRTLPCAE